MLHFVELSNLQQNDVKEKKRLFASALKLNDLNNVYSNRCYKFETKI